MGDEVDFLHADKHERFLQINTIIFDGSGQAFPKFPNSKFAMFLQNIKRKVRDEVDFWNVDKHQSFLRVDPKCEEDDTIIIDVHNQAFSKYSK